MNKILLLLLGLLLFGIQSYAQRLIKTESYEGVVFDSIPRIGVQTGNSFIPSDSEIGQMETILLVSIVSLLTRYKKANPYFRDECNIAKSLATYKRQYVGIQKGGERIIIVYFLLDPYKEWQKKVSIIVDGGCSYFSLEYFIKLKSVKNLYINPPA